MKPDLLCLDEPTNHLDLYACLWLEEYLAEWPTTLLCVAHDVTFLNEVATDIVHLCNQQLTTYAGNFDAFEKQRAEVMLDWERRYKKQQEDLIHYQEFVNKWKDNKFGNNEGLVKVRRPQNPQHPMPFSSDRSAVSAVEAARHRAHEDLAAGRRVW